MPPKKTQTKKPDTFEPKRTVVVAPQMPQGPMVAVGIRKITDGADKGRYASFTVEIQDGEISTYMEKQADVKLAATDTTYQDFMERFISNGDF